MARIPEPFRSYAGSHHTYVLSGDGADFTFENMQNTMLFMSVTPSASSSSSSEFCNASEGKRKAARRPQCPWGLLAGIMGRARPCKTNPQRVGWASASALRATQQTKNPSVGGRSGRRGMSGERGRSRRGSERWSCTRVADADAPAPRPHRRRPYRPRRRGSRSHPHLPTRGVPRATDDGNKDGSAHH